MRLTDKEYEVQGDGGLVVFYRCPRRRISWYAPRQYAPVLALLLRCRDLVLAGWSQHCTDMGLKSPWVYAPWPKWLSFGLPR